ncbi:MAG: hypothetical protein HKN13_13880 [Rhodothermales bacterium]|nr:hypothetical protein [Rhodothermales bacterium]
MYTTFHVKCVVKPEQRKLISDLYNVDYGDSDVSMSDHPWEILWRRNKPNDWLLAWTLVNRCSQIPFGVTVGGTVPEAWHGEDVTDANHPWHTYDVDTGSWEFVCSLKNYGATIDKFCQLVLSNVAESVETAECVYEEFVFDYDEGDYEARDKRDLIQIGG